MNFPVSKLNLKTEIIFPSAVYMYICRAHISNFRQEKIMKRGTRYLLRNFCRLFLPCDLVNRTLRSSISVFSRQAEGSGIYYALFIPSSEDTCSVTRTTLKRTVRTTRGSYFYMAATMCFENNSTAVVRQ